MEGSEEKKLKMKINLLIDKLEERDREKVQLENTVKTLENENLQLTQKLETVLKEDKEEESPGGSQSQIERIMKFYTTFYKIVRVIHQNGQFIAYKNETKYSCFYCKVERGCFEQEIKNAGAELGSFLELCKVLQCIKSEQGGKCVYNNDKIRVYFINRALVNMILADAQENGGQLAATK